MNSKEVEDILKLMNNVHYMSPSTYRDSQLFRALRLLKLNELQAIYHLTESHCPGFRMNASLLYEKSIADDTHKSNPLCKDNFKLSCSNISIEKGVQDLLEKIEEMPEEWSVIQLTESISAKPINPNKDDLTALHITVFQCGQRNIAPITILIDKPIDVEGNTVEIKHEIKSILGQRTEIFSKRPDMLRFSKLNQDANNRMKKVVEDVQSLWLGEWRTLLMGKYFNAENEKKVDEALEKLLTTFNLVDISKKSKILLKYTAKGHFLLSNEEMAGAICNCIPEMIGNDDRLFKFISSMRRILSNKATFNTQQHKHPVILIVDAAIDIIPWEMLDVCANQPVSRMQSLHILYALYKEHDYDIVNGWKMNINHNKGASIINPGQDLKHMENRVTTFFQYWLPEWQIMHGQAPTSDEFLEMLVNCNIVSYAGHGDGFQYLRDTDLRKLRINAVVLLFGCSSVKLESPGPKCEHFGSNQNYITACCPCVVGMLWPVTDRDTDLLCTNFISSWVPSKAACHWKNLDLKSKWETGSAVTNVLKDMPQINKKIFEHDSEMLTALAKAKQIPVGQFLTRAACVARGLPVKT